MELPVLRHKVATKPPCRKSLGIARRESQLKIWREIAHLLVMRGLFDWLAERGMKERTYAH